MGRKIVLLVISMIFTMVFMMCSPSVQMKVLKPAELSIREPVKRVAVLDFQISGVWNLGESRLSSRELELLRAGIELLKGKKSLEIPTEDPATGKQFANEMISSLFNNGYYQVVEREKLDQIIQEQQLALSGLLDESTAVEVGKLLGVDAILVGSGNYSVYDRGEWSEYTRKVTRNKQKVEEKYRSYQVIRTVELQINFRLVSIGTGEIIASNSIKTTRSARSSMEKTLDYFSSNKDRKEREVELQVRQSLSSWKKLLDACIGELCFRITRQIAPHYVTIERTLEKGKTDELKRSIEYIKRGLWEEAVAIWQSIVSNPNHLDRLAATYNLAVYYESIDQLDEAEQLYQQCYDISGKGKYLDHKARIRQRKKELEKLKQQGAFTGENGKESVK